ncbi:MAG: sigma-70 family RNA polymerase sigma factor [Planctomycetaceae bacterium]|nr:sigma-70 family RNA polymerase sigma factor [Planctomycetaceae bacterium]
MDSASSHNSVLLSLLERARGGDDAAREDLFNQCRQYVHLLARSQVETWMKTKVDASDLVQQTLLEAHRGFQEFRGVSEGEWLAWLRMILTHNAQDFVRRYRQTEKRAVRREVSLDAPLPGLSASFRREPVDADSETPSQLLSRQEQEIALANAIGQLSPDHQEVIILRNLQRLPFDEVAERMNRSRPAAQMLWMRAIKRLEELLRDVQ